MTEINHDYTSRIVCPYCGHIHSECYEYADDGKTECDACEMTFHFTRHVIVNYSTKKVKE